MTLSINLVVSYGVDEVWIETENRKLVGQWSQTPTYVSDEQAKTLLTDLVNCPASFSSDGILSILAFTRRYGPLFDAFKPGEKFEQYLQTWIQFQVEMKSIWTQRGWTAAPKHWAKDYQVDANRSVTARNFSNYLDLMARSSEPDGRLIGAAKTIGHWAELILFGQDPRTLRFCWNKECSHRYFIAPDLRAHYCSSDCMEKGIAEQKREWWKERGADWRKSRKEPSPSLQLL
jgi:hypothetical protein